MFGGTVRSGRLVASVGLALAFAAFASGAVWPFAGSAEARDAGQEEEFRAYWVDAFGEGLNSQEKVEELVAETKAANMNAIVAQVGRRGDCFCNEAAMPRTEAGVKPAPFDPLQALIEEAHAEGIEVHAWVISTAIWNSEQAPEAEDHVFNTNGPDAEGDADWLMRREDGELRAGADYSLDPGHPEAADYIVEMYTSIVENYDVDGVNLDRIRYPDFNDEEGVSSWGYNPTAVERFQHQTGRDDRPAPNDPEWSDWRREQVTNVVRKVYLETHAIDPSVRVSADTITYGEGPLQQGGWQESRTYNEVLQDWRAWMREGILDLNVPMNYKRDHEPDQRRWYEQWSEYAKDNQYDRQTIVGSAAYLNDIGGTVNQVREALATSAAGNPSHGWAGYSYRNPDAETLSGDHDSGEGREELAKALTQESRYDEETPSVFADKASTPAMPWKSSEAHIRGTVTEGGEPVDEARVSLYRQRGNEKVEDRRADGSGYFGFVGLEPGRYRVVVEEEGFRGRRAIPVEVSAGEVSDASFAGRGVRQD